ncbi:MAG: hypothetical protein ACFFDM_06935 [Candidatus Thorarchaeota archaeon]
MGKTGVAGGILVFIAGLAVFLDDLHDFLPGTEFFQWIPGASDPFIIGGFQFHHLYLGIILMLIGLVIAVKYDE